MGVVIEPRLQLLGLEVVFSRRKGVRVGGFDELLRKLRDKEKVL